MGTNYPHDVIEVRRDSSLAATSCVELNSVWLESLEPRQLLASVTLADSNDLAITQSKYPGSPFVDSVDMGPQGGAYVGYVDGGPGGSGVDDAMVRGAVVFADLPALSERRVAIDRVAFNVNISKYIPDGADTRPFRVLGLWPASDPGSQVSATTFLTAHPSTQYDLVDLSGNSSALGLFPGSFYDLSYEHISRMLGANLMSGAQGSFVLGLQDVEEEWTHTASDDTTLSVVVPLGGLQVYFTPSPIVSADRDTYEYGEAITWTWDADRIGTSRIDFRLHEVVNGLLKYWWTGDTESWTAVSDAVGQHTFHVQARNTNFDSDTVWGYDWATSAWSSAMPVVVTELHPPTEASAVALTASTVQLSWLDNSGSESRYFVERRTDEGDWVVVAGLDANNQSFIDADLSPGTTYHHRVRAFTDHGGIPGRYSTYSEVTSATTTEAIPPRIGSLSATPDPVAWGQTLFVSANDVTDSQGFVTRVEFYLDSGNGFWSGRAEEIKLDEDRGWPGGWVWSGVVDKSWGVGVKRFYAIAQDNDGAWSRFVTTYVTITESDDGGAGGNQAPFIGALRSDRSDVYRGQQVSLTADGVFDADVDDEVLEVVFYEDSNGSGFFDPFDAEIGRDATGEDGWTMLGQVPADAEYGGIAFFARPYDLAGAAGSAAGVHMTVGAIGGDWGVQPAAFVSGSSDADGLITATTLNRLGRPIAVREAGEESWEAVDLQLVAGGAQAAGNVESWVDPRNARTYAAVASLTGVQLFRRSESGTWDVRNLTLEIPNAGVLVGDITVFVSGGKRVHIAGLDAVGELHLYYQTGASSGAGYEWAERNLSQVDFVATGQQTPAFAGSLISFVTSWNALNIAGLDSQGNIQAVWIAGNMAHWRIDNLSESTGAPPLHGGLTAYLTGWNAINLVGTDASGNVSATWWVPSFGSTWETSDLTALFEGPQLQSSSMTTFVTSWGATNIAGLDSDGELVVYWWAPGVEGNRWAITTLSDTTKSSVTTAGPLRGLTVPQTGSINVFSGSESGDLLRYWWKPGGEWQVDNLTEMV